MPTEESAFAENHPVTAHASSNTEQTLTANNINTIAEQPSPPFDDAALQLLRKGIVAAKAGDKNLARALLFEAIKVNPRNEPAWLWLASVAETLEDRVSCLQRVLEFNPSHERALQWLTEGRRNLAQDLLVKGVAAAKAKDVQAARALLERATEHDPANELAWLWLASVTSVAEDKISILQRVLDINPESEHALKSITQTRSALARTLLQKGVAAVKAGAREQARKIVSEAIEHDATLEDAWLLLAHASDTLEDKAAHLRRALSLNATSTRIGSALETIEAQIRTQALAALAPKCWTCPLCLAESSGQQSDECARCGAVLSLADIERVLANNGADIVMLRAAADRLRARFETDDPTAEDSYNLGLALLNLKQLDEAIAYFRAASRIDSSNELLQARIAILLERRVLQGEEKAAAEAAATEFATQTLQETASSTSQAAHSDAMHRSSESEATRNVGNASAGAISGTPSTRRTIMVVDDSPTVRKLVTIKLEKRGHKVLPAGDGMEALAILNDEVPDLILLDITMPRLDGYQLCKLVRSNSATKDVPVVMLSGKDGFFDKVRGRMAGSTAYITKPFEPEALLKVVDEHCRPAVVVN